jgi:phosphoribosylanthranilate isomerase
MNFYLILPLWKKVLFLIGAYLKNIEINEWFLAGGININNLEKASKISKKIDISSGLEDNPGVKSSKKVSDFLLKVKKL